MKSETMLGTNRTGAKLAPEMLEEMVSGTQEFPPTSAGDAEGLADIRNAYSEEGEPIGTMPPPTGVKQLAKTAAAAVTGGAPMQLLDLIGERLAFERAGTRLWEALVAKHDATGGFKGGPSRDDIAHIRDEELQHFELLRELMERLDADPTAVTPAADIQAVASMGLPQVLTDPRTDFLQCLEAVLVAELVDNDCWPSLLELLAEAGYRDEAAELLCAVESEREHLEKVRSWLAAGQGRSVEAVRNLSQAETQTIMASPAIAALMGTRAETTGDGTDAAGATGRTTKRRTPRTKSRASTKKSPARTARGRAGDEKPRARDKKRLTKGAAGKTVTKSPSRRKPR